MGYFTNCKIGNGSGKYDHNPEAIDKDIANSKIVIEDFKRDFHDLLNKKYYIEKETSYGRWLSYEEKVDLVIDELYKLKTKGEKVNE